MTDSLARTLAAARRALASDRTIDIVTTGAKTGRRRTTEIWFCNIDGRIIICGTPSPETASGRRPGRDWLANLRAEPRFEFQLKESLALALPASAAVVTDPLDRRAVMSARATAWYREQGFGMEELVAHAPIVDVRFLGEFDALNRRH